MDLIQQPSVNEWQSLPSEDTWQQKLDQWQQELLAHDHPDWKSRIAWSNANAGTTGHGDWRDKEHFVNLNKMAELMNDKYKTHPVTNWVEWGLNPENKIEDQQEPDVDDSTPDWADYYSNYSDYMASEYPEVLNPEMDHMD